eukprot:1158816-Pelagomonas_calceolata.AAC.5
MQAVTQGLRHKGFDAGPALQAPECHRADVGCDKGVMQAMTSVAANKQAAHVTHSALFGIQPIKQAYTRVVDEVLHGLQLFLLSQVI